MTLEIPVERLDGSIPLPFKASSRAVGYDLHSNERFLMIPGERHLFGTGLKVAIPTGYAGLILPRSGLALRKGVTVLNAPGLIDPDYRGEVGVLLINHGDEPVDIVQGERIAQLVVAKAEDVLFALTKLDATKRGENGWGSTGG